MRAATDQVNFAAILTRAVAGSPPSAHEARQLARCDDLALLCGAAASLRDRYYPDILSYSRKVFIPLTKLCRDSCHYCTFAKPPRRGEAAFMGADEVLAIAEAGARAGCKEALFTLGDKPELRYRAAREELARLGHPTTLSYLAAMAELVFAKTGLLPHLNPGVLAPDDLKALRKVSVSMGMMLETAAARLSRRGGPHFGSPDKEPAQRLASLAAAGAAQVAFTSGILIGIGETRLERIEALLALRDLHARFGHLQEIIIQNFRAKPDTRMALAPEPSEADLQWTVAVARILLPGQLAIQAPPNLSPGGLAGLIGAGINDCGGISPVTIDHVNPEAPWPAIDSLARQAAAAGKVLTERLAIYPAFVEAASRWLDPALVGRTLQLADAQSYARPPGQWTPGAAVPLDGFEPDHPRRLRPDDRLARILAKPFAGERLAQADIEPLFAARGEAFWRVCAAADQLRRLASGERVGYVVNRNINYTNICTYRCQFCAFSKGRMSENLRGRPYDLDLEEIARRTREAWARGASEVCLQGGIHPAYTGATYLAIVAAIKRAVPDIHVHAFSPLEIFQGAATLGLSVETFLAQLRRAGLGSLPGTAAEILDDEVRAILCPDKLTSAEWLGVVEAAHRQGLPTTATIMFGHVEAPRHWARHLLAVRQLQEATGKITEFVPLPFVPMETPIYLKGRSRRGPTLREAVLMHAVARLALHPAIVNIQASWVKLGAQGVKLCLSAGANDLGGTLMNETISRAAGASHGQEMTPDSMLALIGSLGRVAYQRTTLYGEAPAERVAAGRHPEPLAEISLSGTKNRMIV
jgi:FO synthase